MSKPSLNYVKYDKASIEKSEFLKKEFEQLIGCIEGMMENSREKALIMTGLETAYMWTGKAIRNDQIKRNGSSENLPERSNS